MGHSLTLHSKWQLRGHFLYKVWIIYSILIKIIVHLSSRTVRQIQPSQTLLFLIAMLKPIPILCLLFLLICMVCNYFLLLPNNIVAVLILLPQNDNPLKAKEWHLWTSKHSYAFRVLHKKLLLRLQLASHPWWAGKEKYSFKISDL